MKMRVIKYIPSKMYGFVRPETGDDVFFHLKAFQPGSGPHPHPHCEKCSLMVCPWVSTPPPPILGEAVDVVLSTTPPQPGKAPRAESVQRTALPAPLQGTVDAFDVGRGYGFVNGDDGISYHLHKSEVLEERLPLPGWTVMFYPGVRLDKPRACHIKVCPHG